MKKSLIALAVAGVVSAPAFAATSNVDVYGILNVAVENQDDNGAPAVESMGIVDNASRIGFKGSEDLGGGLKAIWQIESALSGSSAASAGVGGATLAGRNTFVGLSGGFGTFLMGRHDTPYKMSTGAMDVFADTIGDYEDDRLGLAAGLNDAHDGRSSSAIAYVSPSFNGLTAAVAVVTMDEAADNNAMDATSLSLNYANGPLSVAFAYQDADVEIASGAGFGAGTTLAGVLLDDSQSWKLGVGYKFGDLGVNFIYEDGDVDNVGDFTNWVLNAQYNMGPIALKAAYYDSELDPNGAGSLDSDQWVVGMDYSLSKRTTAYVVYTDGDSDITTDNKGWNIGLKHSF